MSTLVGFMVMWIPGFAVLCLFDSWLKSTVHWRLNLFLSLFMAVAIQLILK